MLRIPHCLDNRLTDGGQVVSPTHPPHLIKSNELEILIPGPVQILEVTQILLRIFLVFFSISNQMKGNISNMSRAFLSAPIALQFDLFSLRQLTVSVVEINYS
jgi:hypothetical protein